MKQTTFLMALAVLAVFTGCSKQAKKSGGERETRVNIMQLEKRNFRRQIPLQGTVMPVEYATISAKINGTLEILKVDEGDRRKKGDFLFGIDRQVLENQVVVKEDEIKVKEAALKNAEFALKSVEISCYKAKLDYDRALTLRKSNAISQSEFESIETLYKKQQNDVLSAQAEIVTSKAQLKQAQSDLEIAKKNLDDSVIKAPFDCVIADKYVEEKEYVSAGQNILKLENHNDLEVICYISAVYYNQVEPGKTRVEFVDGDGKVLGEAKVSYRSPGIDPESRTFKMKIAVPKDVPLVSGMLCELKIILEEKEAYGLPSTAVLLRAGGRMIAYTINDQSRAESVEVKTGITDGGYSEILNASGLLGKRFVISGQTFINNGSLLRIAGNRGE